RDRERKERVIDAKRRRERNTRSTRGTRRDQTSCASCASCVPFPPPNSEAMKLYESVRAELERLEATKTFKQETVIESEQGAVVRAAGKDVVMLASNNYLGLASHPRI